MEEQGQEASQKIQHLEGILVQLQGKVCVLVSTLLTSNKGNTLLFWMRNNII